MISSDRLTFLCLNCVLEDTIRSSYEKRSIDLFGQVSRIDMRAHKMAPQSCSRLCLSELCFRLSSNRSESVPFCVATVTYYQMTSIRAIGLYSVSKVHLLFLDCCTVDCSVPVCVVTRELFSIIVVWWVAEKNVITFVSPHRVTF